jgi:hypothetical protein
MADIFRILQLYFGIFRLISIDSKFAYTHFKYVKKLSNEKFLDIRELDENFLTYYNVPCSTLTHSTNEDLLNIKRKGDPKSRTLSPTSDTTETRNPSVIKSFC